MNHSESQWYPTDTPLIPHLYPYNAPVSFDVIKLTQTTLY